MTRYLAICVALLGCHRVGLPAGYEGPVLLCHPSHDGGLPTCDELHGATREAIDVAHRDFQRYLDASLRSEAAPSEFLRCMSHVEMYRESLGVVGSDFRIHFSPGDGCLPQGGMMSGGGAIYLVRSSDLTIVKRELVE